MRFGLIICERVTVQPVGQNITLFAEWQWRDFAEGQSNEGVVGEPSACAGNGAAMCGHG